MGKIGNGYGSEFHLRRYLMESPALLTERIVDALGKPLARVQWLHRESGKEWKGLQFSSFSPRVMEQWKSFWPQTGNPPNWDAVGQLSSSVADEWLLVEAKANEAEFVSPPSGASRRSREQIEGAMRAVKEFLGIDPDTNWMGPYYQYANRLAILFFLNEIARVPAHLFFVYFLGDCFPDGRPCPASESRWQELIAECHRTLKVPGTHPLSARVHDLFIPVLR